MRQGDLLHDCWIPEFPPDFADQTEGARIIQADQADLIVLSQSCDLEYGKITLVALCHVRNGRSPTLHLLTSPMVPQDARAALLVDFRAIYSLPFAYLTRHT